MANQYEKLLELNERGRCVKCKRREDEMITCQRCMEFKYCSKKCQEDDLDAHMILCNLIGIKKGILVQLTTEQAEYEQKIIEKARCLNDDGSIKIMKETLSNEQDKNKSGHNQVQDSPWKHRRGQKKKHSNRKKVGQNKNGNSSKDEHLDGKKKKENSVESLIAGGRFGQVGKFGSKEDSGKSFGAGWWKLKPKPKTSQTEGCSETASSGKKNAKVEMKFKDFYSDSEDDETDKKSDSKETSQGGKNEIPSSTFKSASDEPLESAQYGMELEKYDPKKAEEAMARNPSSQGRVKPGQCFYCKKEGNVLKCSRCKVATYCDRVCQTAHYQQHKDMCRLKEKYFSASMKIPDLLITVLELMRGPLEISVDLRDVQHPFEAMVFPSNTAILVYILAEHPHPLLYGGIVRDLRGQVTQVLFCTPTDIYLHTVSRLFCPIIPIRLSMCIQPGNFIILLRPQWSYFPDGQRGIRIDDMADVHFVFMDD